MYRSLFFAWIHLPLWIWCSPHFSNGPPKRVEFQSTQNVNVVPLPVSVGPIGPGTYLNVPFSCATSSTSKILAEACDRYMAQLIFTRVPSSTAPAGSPSVITITIQNDDENNLQYGVDESYELITGPVNKISSKTLWGALRGLETFSQLVTYDMDRGLYTVNKTQIDDKPRFSHRGLMLDPARHFIPVRMIKKIMDSMSYAKLNVLHLHLTDDESFAPQIKSMPLFWKASFTTFERYTVNDIMDLVAFGKARGIRVMVEFDMPGHARSWCKGYPYVCPASNCTSPLDVSNNATFDAVDKIVTEYGSYFFDDFFHFGGDEVNVNCYNSVPHIAQWLKDHNFTALDGYKYFVKQVEQIGHNHKKTVVQWVEVYDEFGTALDKSTVVHVWKAKTTLQKVVADGYRAILSDYADWYLDNVRITWEQMYMNEPYEGIDNTTQQELILGGETCAWGDGIDAGDVQALVWPRSAAVAERLWSPRNFNDSKEALVRMERFRCLLLSRGIASPAVTNPIADAPPPGYTSCLI